MNTNLTFLFSQFEWLGNLVTPTTYRTSPLHPDRQTVFVSALALVGTIGSVEMVGCSILLNLLWGVLTYSQIDDSQRGF